MNDKNIQEQFSVRVNTFNTAANWMLDEDLINIHVEVARQALPIQTDCLDLCCGTGIIGKAFIDKGWRATGIDITYEMAKKSQKVFNSTCASIEYMPFNDNSFDLVVLRQSYMLVNGPAVLKEIKRVLREGGIFILSQSVSFSSGDDARYRMVQLARHINIVKYYTTQDLIQELTENGFDVQGKRFLRVRESVNKWLDSAPGLSVNLRNEIFKLIKTASPEYKEIRNVEFCDGQLHEDWNWIVITACSI